MDTAKELTHISLCTGYGGIDLGLKRAIGKVRTITYVEIEAFVIENLVSKIESGHLDAAPIFTDLKRFPWRKFARRVDILSGGFPCQPFSSAGAKNADTDPRHLWPYITKGIRELERPAIVFFENVEGILSSKLKGTDWPDPEGTPILLHILRELERLGYNATASLFSASEIGAPHQRKRLFILGVRSDLSNEGRERVNRLLKRFSEESTELENSDNIRGESLNIQGSSEAFESGGVLSKVSDRSDSRACSKPNQKLGYSYGGDEGSREQQREHASTQTSHWKASQLDGSSADRKASNAKELGNSESGSLESSNGGRGLFQGSVPHSNRESSEGSGVPRYAFPAFRGAAQFIWEPPRVTNADSKASEITQRLSNAVVYRDYSMATASPSTNDPKLGNTGDSGHLRSRNDESASSTKRWEIETRYCPSASLRSGELFGKAEPSMGGDSNGTPNWMEYAELCISLDNRTDELRMLGNGVVPATAERAFQILWERLC